MHISTDGNIKKISLQDVELDNNARGGGLEIRVPGYSGSPESPDEAQIFIEHYDGKVRVHVWNGKTDPVTVELTKEG